MYTAFDVTVDGVSLDSLAWNIDSKVRPWAGVRAGNVVVPGVDGVVASINDDLEPVVWVLSMWAIGVNSSGVIPGGSNAMSQVRANLDALSFMFRKQYTLLDVREVVDHLGTVRQGLCKVEDTISPEVKAGGSGRFTVPLLVPAGVLQDVSTSDWSQASAVSGTAYEVTTLQGSTGPITDGTILVTGPATNPQVTDVTTGAYVRLNAALPAGQQWRVNSATWVTRHGSGLTLGSADTAGTDGQAITVYGGGNSHFLRMYPVLDTGLRRVKLTLSGTGFTSATALAVRARKKFLQ